MNKGKLTRTLLSATAFVLMLAVSIGIILELNTKKESLSPGCSLAKLMYEFSNPEELSGRYDQLRSILSQKDWDKLTLDDPMRAVNTYYKFGYESSAVIPRYQSNSSLCYSLVNANVPSDTLWVLDYTLGEDKRIKDVREYEVVHVARAGDGALR